MLNRREMIVSSAGAALTLTLARNLPAFGADDFALPPLPYPVNALEPYIDAQTMEIHHGKHHQAYIDRLVATLKADAPELLERPLGELVAGWEKLPEAVRTVVRNHGGGHFNHSLFWHMMAPEGSGGDPSRELSAALDAAFGGMDGFRKEWLARAAGQFGSGWAWLVLGADKKLSIVATPNQDNPVSSGQWPLLGVDVWEHAYYLKYQNRRPAYVEAWFNIINWNYVNELFAAASRQ